MSGELHNKKRSIKKDAAKICGGLQKAVLFVCKPLSLLVTTLQPKSCNQTAAFVDDLDLRVARWTEAGVSIQTIDACTSMKAWVRLTVVDFNLTPHTFETFKWKDTN